jgi:hypothetical protein
MAESGRRGDFKLQKIDSRPIYRIALDNKFNTPKQSLGARREVNRKGKKKKAASINGTAFMVFS